MRHEETRPGHESPERTAEVYGGLIERHSPENVAAPMPKPPTGFAACRVGYNPQITHLVMLDSKGSNGGRPTMCRLTRFDTKDPHTHEVLLRADLPGWSMGGGFSGRDVQQVECPECYARVIPPEATDR